MGNICPPNKNNSHNSNGGRSAGYISNEPVGVKVAGAVGNGHLDSNQNSSYPIVNIGNGNVGYGNQHSDMMGEYSRARLLCLLSI